VNHWYSIYGTGLTVCDIRHTADGRLHFTVWLCLFSLPLVPVSSWTAAGACKREFGGELDLGHTFVGLTRAPHQPRRLVRTFAVGWALAASALIPMAVLIDRTNGRAAETWEFVLVMALTVWAAGLMIDPLIRRDRLLARPVVPFRESRFLGRSRS
jgi:hypothetical protein